MYCQRFVYVGATNNIGNDSTAQIYKNEAWYITTLIIVLQTNILVLVGR